MAKSFLKLRLLIAILLLTSAGIRSQSMNQPQEIVEKYFGNELPDYNQVLTANAREQHIFPDTYDDEISRFYEVLHAQDSLAVISVTLDDGKYAIDLYVYLTMLQGEWKIESFRSLWLPDFYYLILETFQGLDEKGIKARFESMVELLGNDSGSEVLPEPFSNTHDPDIFVAEIRAMQLTAGPDRDLIAHFNSNRKQFDKLLHKILSDSIVASGDSWRLGPKDDFCQPEIKTMLVSSIAPIMDGTCIDFVLGGVLDNTAGYFYCCENAQLPRIGQDGYIMIKSLGGGWYLRKTT
jgi:hypothetical protein